MAVDLKRALDDLDWRILAELHADARLPYSELGRRISLSPPAVAERVRRLEEAGVIVGYRAVLDYERLGFPLLAFVRVRYPSGDHRPFERAVRQRPEILECHHVTGEGCFVVKLVARSMRDLEATAGFLAGHGAVTTSLAYSTVVAWPPAPGPSPPE
jgi:Lrp/AsnC family transcriptional regulator, leucine-responsive regulatory protein